MADLASALHHTQFVSFDRNGTIVVIGVPYDSDSSHLVDYDSDKSMLTAAQVRDLGELLTRERRVVGIRLENAVLDVDALDAIVTIARDDHHITSFAMICGGPPATEGLTDYPIVASMMVLTILRNPNIEIFKVTDTVLRWDPEACMPILITMIHNHRKLRKLALTHLTLNYDVGKLACAISECRSLTHYDLSFQDSGLSIVSRHTSLDSFADHFVDRLYY
jgi:hypothetical protein